LAARTGRDALNRDRWAVAFSSGYVHPSKAASAIPAFLSTPRMVFLRQSRGTKILVGTILRAFSVRDRLRSSQTETAAAREPGCCDLCHLVDFASRNVPRSRVRGQTASG